ncbi:PilZ domain-containing protein [uncultured Bradyrhizobium sp.]|uniref:PilZ domain-containing protein n=1 Tax=uncultured Bradyrhizobium sp. TaxID=199684 RepID=UPI0035CBFB24
MSSQPAILATAMEDRRRGPRADVDEPAYISSGGSSTRCRLVNVSAEGAAIEVPDPAFIPGRFQLMTENDRVVRNCRIVWTKQNRIGVVFE